jgi:hypothetical protein
MWVRRLLKERTLKDDPTAERRFVWLGGKPVCESVGKRTRLILPGHTSDEAVTLPNQQAQWLDNLIRQSTPHNNPSHPYPLLREVKTTFPDTVKDFETFLGTTSWKKVRNAGLLLV